METVKNSKNKLLYLILGIVFVITIISIVLPSTQNFALGSIGLLALITLIILLTDPIYRQRIRKNLVWIILTLIILGCINGFLIYRVQSQLKDLNEVKK